MKARASCRNGKCESVELENVPCFAHQLDAVIDVGGVGRMPVDIAYGGMFFAIADAAALGFEIRPDEAVLRNRRFEPVVLHPRRAL